MYHVCIDEPPFLKWAGGKSWFTKKVIALVKDLNYNSYFEPFLGGGAVFFALHPQSAFLSDFNAELIDTYKAVQDDYQAIIAILKTFVNDEENYYIIRKTINDNPYYMAARFIFLNHTSYNGLYRVNRKGMYNVPYGKRQSANFVLENSLAIAHERLQGIELSHCDFAMQLEKIREGDLVFLDPPYTSYQNSFVSYNAKLFSLEDQIRLSQFIETLKKKGAYYILTNAAAPEIRKIFDNGDKFYILNRQSVIGGTKAKRGLIEEYVFTNIQGVCEND